MALKRISPDSPSQPLVPLAFKKKSYREAYISQLAPTNKLLAKYNVKFLGCSSTGKTTLIKSLKAGLFLSLFAKRQSQTSAFPGKKNLNIDDIIENKNFQMLEKNLINVINCNLEREYDLKVLDRNFVKLFKLAQLGVDYLSYCELYLDRCVVLLQDQLIALQEEYELLKQENAKKCEELRKSKKKSRIQSYQCEKCDKVFINEVYLKCHEKRRHWNSKTGKSSEGSPKSFIDKCQQTETEESSQNPVPVEKRDNVMESKEDDEVEMIKKENKIKIENLEKELEEVKSRLKKAESTLTTKCEAAIPSSVPQPVSYPNPGPAPNTGSIFYPPMLQWIPSYLPQPRINYFNYTQGYESLVSETEPQDNCYLSDLPNSRAVDSKNFFDDEPSSNSGSRDNLRGKEPEGEIMDDSLSRRNNRNPVRTRDSEKENVDPMEDKVLANSGKSRLFPRKMRTQSQTNIEEETLVRKTPLEGFQMDPEGFERDLITHSSTPLKEKQETEVKVNICEEGKPEDSSNNGIASGQRKPKSFLKKLFVKRSTPKLQELSKNLRTSLTSLYDSVSYGGKEPRKTKESRNTVMDGLHGELRKLGIDPEWSGIPKNTVHQKLKMLKHRRKLMTKENPLYPVVRKGIEKNVLKRLDSYSKRKKEVVKGESDEQESIEVKSLDTSHKTSGITDNLETGSESESDFNNLEASRDVGRGQKLTWSKEELEKDGSSNEDSKEFDFSVFQVSKGRDSKQSATSRVSFGVIEDLEIVSDLDSQKSDDGDNSDSHVLEGRPRNGEENTSGGESKNKWEFPEGKHQKTPKSTLRSQDQKPQVTGLKKKVVFIDLSEGREGKESETIGIGNKSNSTRQSIGNEDVWASKSNWDSCDGAMGGVG